jgi:hypothetical protein
MSEGSTYDGAGRLVKKEDWHFDTKTGTRNDTKGRGTGPNFLVSKAQKKARFDERL